ncbi:MAG: hypothetical protein ACREU7_16500 [Burkholderiales bacterium]
MVQRGGSWRVRKEGTDLRQKSYADEPVLIARQIHQMFRGQVFEFQSCILPPAQLTQQVDDANTPPWDRGIAGGKTPCHRLQLPKAPLLLAHREHQGAEDLERIRTHPRLRPQTFLQQPLSVVEPAIQ